MSARLGDYVPNPRSRGLHGGLNTFHPEYRSTGLHLRSLLVRYAGLTPHSNVLDIGCGTGRLAVALSDYLTDGTYVGLDVHPGYLAAARRQCRFRRGFGFRRLRAYHPEYNHQGCHDSTWPVEPGSYNIGICFGVLNHLNFSAAANLLARAAGYLQHAGHFCCTVRLLNHLSMQPPRCDFLSHRLDSSWHRSAVRLTLDVALPEEGFRRAAIAAGLLVCDPVRYGYWAGGPAALDELDFLVARRV